MVIWPYEGSIVRLIGAKLLEQNGECAASRVLYVTLEKLAQFSADAQACPSRIAAA
jgi:hypothetical protein